MKVYPDLSTPRSCPGSRTPASAWPTSSSTASRSPSTRAILLAGRRARERGFTAACGHELEFFLLRLGLGLRAVRVHARLVYTHTPAVDTQGVVREMEDAVSALGLPYVCSNQEYFGSQWEINLKYAEALEAADDAHLLKLAIKDVAKHGLLATFMGKPLDGEELGYHLHLSALGERRERIRGRRLARRPLRRVPTLRRRPARACAMTVVLAPTINAYKRFIAFSMALYTVTWGPDNRTVFVRVPAERGKATRIENRAGDGTANAYLAAAAAIFAGIDGLDRKLDPGEATRGDAYAADGVPLFRLASGGTRCARGRRVHDRDARSAVSRQPSSR